MACIKQPVLTAPSQAHPSCLFRSSQLFLPSTQLALAARLQAPGLLRSIEVVPKSLVSPESQLPQILPVFPAAFPPYLKPSDATISPSQCPTSAWGFAQSGQQVALRLPFPHCRTKGQTHQDPLPPFLLRGNKSGFCDL
jgi:hypothetical protein